MAVLIQRLIDASATVRMVATLARAVERMFGTPQDVEWAIGADELWLLQARSITALPEPPAFDIPSDGFWMKDEAHYPAPLTPFGASVYLPMVEFGMSAMIQEFGLPFDRMYQRSLGGEAYTRVVPPGGKDRSPPPWWLLAILTRLLPSMCRREKVARRALETNLVEELLAQWPSWRAQFLSEASTRRAVDLTELGDDALVAQLDAAIDLSRRGQVVHFRLFLPYILAFYELGTACESCSDGRRRARWRSYRGRLRRHPSRVVHLLGWRPPSVVRPRRSPSCATAGGMRWSGCGPTPPRSPGGSTSSSTGTGARR